MNAVITYHESSKHQLKRYAPGPDGLDWATQPDPFRKYLGSKLVQLPVIEGELSSTWDELFLPQGIPSREFNVETVANLLQLSFGISAWKSYGGSRWALRCNPSSGNLHPTEAYLITPKLNGLGAGVYHYQASTHELEQRSVASFKWNEGVLVAITGIHWREAWKYGIRAFRYCQHDCGHALAALSYAARALGWPARLLSNWGDLEIEAVTGIRREQNFSDAEHETAEAIVWIGPGKSPSAQQVIEMLGLAEWRGHANVLSQDHRDWTDIQLVVNATYRPPGTSESETSFPVLPALDPASEVPVTQLIRQRRSAQAFDGISTMTAERFFRVLDALMPRKHIPPWSLHDIKPSIHLVLFVHRVQYLEAGVYCLVRDLESVAELRAEMDEGWCWQEVPGCPNHLPFYLLTKMDSKDFARTASCHQDIASDSVFSLAMLAKFDDITDEHPWRYLDRFRESGMIGQTLYLEAEAAGVQGTGIGCFFDDVVHQALGLKSNKYQDIYHFTVGQALTDRRILTEPAYSKIM